MSQLLEDMSLDTGEESSNDTNTISIGEQPLYNNSIQEDMSLDNEDISLDVEEVQPKPTTTVEKDVEEVEEVANPESEDNILANTVSKNILGDFLQSSQGTEALGAGVYDRQMAQFRKETEEENIVSEDMRPTPESVMRTGLSELDFIDPEITNFTDRTEKLVDGALEKINMIETTALNQGMTESEFVQKNIYDNMEEGPLRSMLELTGASGFKGLMYFQYGFGNVVGGFADGVENLAKEVQTSYPNAYKKITSRDPRSFANQVTRDAGDLLMSLEGASLNVFAKSSKDIAKSAGVNIDLFKTGLGQVKKDIKKQRQKNWGDRYFESAKIKPTGFDTRKLERIKADLDREANVPSLFRDSKLNPDLLKASTLEAAKKAEELASKTASKYIDNDPDLVQELQDQINLDSRSSETLKITASATTSPEKIARVEAITGKTISKVDEETGELVIDPDEVRLAGIEVLDEKAKGLEGALFNPTLSVESFDSLISVVGDLKKRHPSYFDDVVVGENYTAVYGTPPKLKLTDKIFNAMVEEDLVGDPEFLNSLTNYGMKFEDFMLAVMGSTSQAGKLLNKVSQLATKKSATGRGVPKILNESEGLTRKEVKELQEQGLLRKIFSGFVRWEGIRRGLLVSQMKTASRNGSSFLIRSPLEGVENYLDTVLYNLANEGIGKAGRSLVSWTNVKDSFRHMKYAFSMRSYMDQKEYVDFILADKTMGGLHKKLFDNINEIRKGREFKGEGKITAGANAIFEIAETGVDILNIPNRFQEFVTRRATFLAELQRLVQREYDVNFIEEINNGKLASFINDSMAPNKNTRSFYDLAAEAAEKSLDVTYAKTPDVPIFREASNIIVKYGLTPIVDFPRFMFNGMELIAQYSLGSLVALGQKVGGASSLTRTGRKYLTRNITGLAAIYGLYKYLESDDAPEDYKQVRLGPNHSKEIEKLEKERDSIAIKTQVNGLDVLIPKNKDMIGTGEIQGRYDALTRRIAKLAIEMQEPQMSLDVSGHYPMRQGFFIANMAREAIKARGSILDYDREWYMGTYWPEAKRKLATYFETSEGKEVVDVITGAGTARGTGAPVVQLLVDLFRPGELDGLSSKALNEKIAYTLGNYVQTHVVKLIEIAEMQRILGDRTLERKDVATDPSPDVSTFYDNFTRPFRQSGIANLFDPESEANRPTRVSIFGKDREQRYQPILNLLAGLNITALPNESGEYLESLGLAEFMSGAKKSIVPSYRRLTNKYIQNRLPVVVPIMKEVMEPIFRKQYAKSSQRNKELYSEEDYVKKESLMYMTEWLGKLRSVGNVVANSKLSKSIPTEQLRFYIALDKYKKVPRKQRVASSSRFIEKYDRPPEVYNTKDLELLLIINSKIKETIAKTTSKIK